MISGPPVTDESLEQAYVEVDNQRRISRLGIALVLSIVLVPAGVIIDFFVYREQVLQLFGFRLLTALVLAILYAIVRLRPLALHQTARLGVLAAFVDLAPFLLIIYVTNGAESPYYAGLNLVILGLSVLLPWSTRETVIVCLGSIILYTLVSLAHGNLFEPMVLPLFFNNAFFILITSIICVVSASLQTKARFNDFKLRHQLDRQNKALQAVDQMKTNFFSNVTHELRTPLTLLLGPIETVLKRPDLLDPKVHDNLILAQRNALRLLKLINDLLDLTRMEQSEDSFQTRRLDLEAFLAGLVDSVRHLGLAKGLSIQFVANDGDLQINADPARLEKIVLNLLTNAIKFTPRGGRIQVSVDQSETEAIIEVADTGKGIDPDQLPRIFERFYQVAGQKGDQSQGVGIGLALAKELTERHGGRLLAESIPGKGTTFFVHLPKPDSAAETLAQSQPTAELKGPPVSEDVEPFRDAFRSADRTFVSRATEEEEGLSIVGKGEETILVVDDEPDMLRYIVGFLSETYRVIQVGHGREAETIVAEHRPDLAILDWMLPGRSGLDICRALRAQPENQDLKIIMLTARVDEPSKLDALKAGADDFLTKPFSSVEVITRVQNQLANAKLQRQLRSRNTELQGTIEKLAETESKLIQSEKMGALGALSAGLLHEVNNPLNYAYSGVQLLQMAAEDFDQDTQETLVDIAEGLKRIKDVVTDLKVFAYPEKPDQVSTFSLLDTFETARKIAIRAGDAVDLQVSIPPELEMNGQRTQIMHIFINLLTNAIKALADRQKSGDAIIKIEGSGDNDTVTIRFSDNGCGMPEEVRRRIFEPFFTTRDVGEGMGMGLSICHTIIENHDGTVDVASVVNEGTTFTLTFPRSKEFHNYD